MTNDPDVKAHAERVAKLRLLLPAKHHELLDDVIDYLESERDEAREQLESLEEEYEYSDREKDEALEAVKYWMHDVYILKRPMRDPRVILRKVESVL